MGWNKHSILVNGAACERMTVVRKHSECMTVQMHGMIQITLIVKIHFDNQSNLYHPMHLHGHTFTVLAHNGHPLTGSPVHQDTVLIPPHESYDVAFLANNPGIWMLHCHNL